MCFKIQSDACQVVKADKIIIALLWRNPCHFAKKRRMLKLLDSYIAGNIDFWKKMTFFLVFQPFCWAVMLMNHRSVWAHKARYCCLYRCNNNGLLCIYSICFISVTMHYLVSKIFKQAICDYNLSLDDFNKNFKRLSC